MRCIGDDGLCGLGGYCAACPHRPGPKRKTERNAVIVARVLAGESLVSVARDYFCTSENIRRIMLQNGYRKGWVATGDAEGKGGAMGEMQAEGQADSD